MPYISPYGDESKKKKSSGYKSPYGSSAPSSAPGDWSPQSFLGIAPNSVPLKTQYSGIGELLRRPSEVGVSSAASDTPLKTAIDVLIHGESPEQYAADTAKLERGLPKGLKPVNDFMVQTMLDPTMYLGGSGALEKGTSKVTDAAMPRIVSAANSNGGKTALADAFDLLTHNGPGVRAVYRGVGYDASKAEPLLGDLRLLERQFQNNTAQRADILDRAVDTALDQVPKDQRMLVFKAIDKGKIDNLPSDLQDAAKQLKAVFDNQAYFQGTKGVRNKLGQDFTPMDELLQAMGPRARGILKKSRESYIPYGRNLEMTDLEDSLSGPLTEEELMNPESRLNVVAKGKALTDAADPFAKARDQLTAMLDDPDEVTRLIKARNKAFARSTSASDLAQALKRAYAPAKQVMRTVKPDIDTGQIYRDAVAGLSAADRTTVNKLLKGLSPEGISRRLVDRANTIKDAIETSQGRGLTEQVPTQGFTRAFGDIPSHIRAYFAGQPNVPMSAKPALEQFLNRPIAGNLPAINEALQKYQRFRNALRFTLPFYHEANVTGLAAATDPLAAIEGFARGAVDPEINPLAHLLGPLNTKGANSALIEGMRKAGVTSYVPERSVPELLQKVPGLAQLSRASGTALWKYDDLLRALATRNRELGGESLGDAARYVNKRMVDYGSNAPIANAAKSVVPFGKFRAGIPGAVALSLIEHPERYAALDRLTHGMFTGGTQTDENGNKKKWYLPSSDVLRLDPGAYARSSVADPLKDVLSLLGMHDATYGIKPNAKNGRFWKLVVTQSPLGDIPGMEYVLDKLGLTPFKETSPVDSLLPVRL